MAETDGAKATETPDLNYVQYEPSKEAEHLPAIRQLISKDLSEPYSIYVYRYFLYQWGELCYMVCTSFFHSLLWTIQTSSSLPIPYSNLHANTHAYQALDPLTSSLIGIIICKLEPHRSGTFRGYIAMLAVSSPYRGRGIASKLVSMAIDAMRARDADEVVLETEVTNTASLKLYERLGFLRSKRLHRYYLNGNAAFRLILYLKEGTAAKSLGGREAAGIGMGGGLGQDGEMMGMGQDGGSAGFREEEGMVA